MYLKTISTSSVEVTEPEIPFWIERKRILDQLEKMKLLFAYSVCPGLDLEFCQKVLKIDNPHPLIDALRSLGVPVFFDRVTSITTHRSASLEKNGENSQAEEVDSK